MRKGLTVSQNFQIFKQLIENASSQSLKNKDLSLIMGLSEGIISALRSICLKPENYPPILFSKILDNKLTFKAIRTLAPKSYNQIEQELSKSNTVDNEISRNVIKTRGRQGGAIKKYATFKISDKKESEVFNDYCLIVSQK